MATAKSQGRDPLFVSSSSSSSKSDRAAAIRIRFADIIVKSSSNKSEAMTKMRREKQRKLLQEEKARMKIRQEARLAVLKVEEEEARSDCRYVNPLSVEKELLNLIGGSRRARDRSLFKRFGLVLKTDVDDDVLDDLEEDLRDDKLFLIDHHVTSAQISKGIRAYHSCIADMNIVNKTLGCVSVYKCQSSATEPMIIQMYKEEFGAASELTQVPAVG